MPTPSSPRKPTTKRSPTKKSRQSPAKKPKVVVTVESDSDSDDELDILTRTGAHKRRPVRNESRPSPGKKPRTMSVSRPPSSRSRPASSSKQRERPRKSATTNELQIEQRPSSPKKRREEYDLKSCLDIQKRFTLAALCGPSTLTLVENSHNEMASQQLSDMLQGTIDRCEGNSCLLLGPRGSGKSTILESCIRSAYNGDKKPIVIRLSGWMQQSDRQAMREIATQLREQTGTSFLSQDEADSDADENDADEELIFSEPVTSQLPMLISIIPTLSRPTLIVLDAFDLFTLHARQALLYCLLDTAQSVRSGVSTSGMAVIGMTSRIDTINLLEKRVKSRFSGRIFKSGFLDSLEDWIDTSRMLLCPEVKVLGDPSFLYWSRTWEQRVDEFLDDKETGQAINDTFGIVKDVRLWIRILSSMVVRLSPSDPWLTAAKLPASIDTHRSRCRLPVLSQMSYSSICLLVASVHASTAGYPHITFEMLYNYFREQVRSSAAAPVQVNGGSIGMVGVARGVLMSEFEGLVAAKFFAPSGPGSTMSKEYAKFRCTLDREEIKQAVEASGQVTLKKWFTKG